LSRVYFRPLQRLAKRAETYTDEDPLFFSFRKEDDEFSILSTSLNKMLQRISEDKGVLKETIGSLKETNRELQKAQNDVIRAEKLATVGRLTSGIAHEIGNPIGIVLGYLDLMKQTDLSRDEQNDFIRRSEKEITRIHHIIRQLLDMTRTSSNESKPIAVHPLLEDLVSVFSYQPSADGIVFESRFNACEDLVVADPERLRQVFLNILLNAVDAINSKPPSKPRIQLITDCPIDENGSCGKDRKPVLDIQIKDNGPGIQPSDLNHIFDPFFTTKQPGAGTGLGLSVSFMIIEKMGGAISVSSSGEEGTLFRVRLPLAE
jgi:signal transduction histidine kinase